MDDGLSPDDPLHQVVRTLHRDIPIADGLPQRMVRRERRQRRVRIGASVLVMAVAVLALEPRFDGKENVTFALQRPVSGHVSLVGDFTDWRTDKLALSPTRNGGWEVTLRLRPGRYRYAYVTDGGEWVSDANAAPVLDDFGRPTSVVTVVAE
jgi:1,4-alpha-glucan branching enzyme